MTIDVLVVDDNGINLAHAQLILEQSGLRVGAVRSNGAVLNAARALQPNVILLDVRVPDVDGYTVCQQLKGDEATKHMPVIFVTALSDTEAETRSFEAGGADFISKPINDRVLLARIKTHIARSAQRRSLEGMFRDVIEFAPAVFILADANGNIVQTNAQAEQQFGYPRAALIGMPVANILPAYHAHSTRTTHHAPVELVCRKRDGTLFPGDAAFGLLDTSHGLLQMVVLNNISDKKDTLQKLKESRQLLRELAAQHEAARENERRHIAREVHDELGQVLSALRMDLSLLSIQHGAEMPPLVARVGAMKSLVDRAIAGVRSIAGNLRPPAIDLGLEAALDWLADECKKHTGIQVTQNSDCAGMQMDDACAILIYRIVQESLSNTIKYAQATRVDIAMQLKDGCLCVSVKDNGIGFDPLVVKSRKTFGILGMRERAITLGAVLKVQSQPGMGTCVLVDIPADSLLAKDAP